MTLAPADAGESRMDRYPATSGVLSLSPLDRYSMPADQRRCRATCANSAIILTSSAKASASLPQGSSRGSSLVSMVPLTATAPKLSVAFSSAHPRTCGDRSPAITGLTGGNGSSPPVRRPHGPNGRDDLIERLIPACAETACLGTITSSTSSAHPPRVVTNGVIAATAAGLKVQERQMSDGEMTALSQAVRLRAAKKKKPV
jgi:hypothetical protein